MRPDCEYRSFAESASDWRGTAFLGRSSCRNRRFGRRFFLILHQFDQCPFVGQIDLGQLRYPPLFFFFWLEDDALRSAIFIGRPAIFIGPGLQWKWKSIQMLLEGATDIMRARELAQSRDRILSQADCDKAAVTRHRFPTGPGASPAPVY